MIHRAIAAVLVALLPIAFTGCGQSGPSYEERITAAENARRIAEEALKKAKEGEDEAERDAERWRLYTIVAACLGGVLLVLGAGLGSSARKEAQRLSHEEQRKGKDDD